MRQVPGGGTVTRGSSAPLVVVLSARTAEHVRQLAQSGWDGPVLLVGSVAEAQQVIGATPSGRAPGAGSAPVHGSSAHPPAPAASSVAAPQRSTSAQVRPEGALRLDVDRQRVVHGSHAEGLTPLEFGVLEALLRTPGRVHRYAELTRGVWGTTYTGDASSLHAVVRRLRRKLQAVRAPVELEAVRGIGFRLGRQELPHGGDPAGRSRGGVSHPDLAAVSG